MKKLILLLSLLLLTNHTFSQKKEKLKGSKVIVIQQKKVEPFTSFEVLDDLEISLIKGDKCGVELEADDNLQESLSLRMEGKNLIIGYGQDISSYKRYKIRVTYTNDLKTITARNKSKITALETIKLDNIVIKALENSKLFINIEVKNFTLSIDDKAKVEMSAKAETAQIDVSKNSEIKALVAANTLKCDMYQKADANIEGDVINLKLRLDNQARFICKKLTAKNTELIIEGNARCATVAETSIKIDASGTPEIELFGTPKIEIVRFDGTALLQKRETK